MTHPKLKAWSFSRYDAYTLCPLKFKRVMLEKAVPFEPSPQMQRGDRIHRAIADHLHTPDKAPPPSVALTGEDAFKHHHDTIAELTQFSDKVVEQQWGFDRQWRGTGWFSKGSQETWLRQILDVGVLYEDSTAEAVDWKTGKHYGSHEDQMELQALCVMLRVPHAEHVTTRLAYLDAGGVEMGEYPAADKDLLIAKWEEKVRPMFEDNEFLPRPNDKCKWCPLRRSNGGECRYG